MHIYYIDIGEIPEYLPLVKGYLHCLQCEDIDVVIVTILSANHLKAFGAVQPYVAANIRYGCKLVESIHSDEGLTLETSVFESCTVANLPYRPCG